jgi:Tfp pilus assembly protein PilE
MKVLALVALLSYSAFAQKTTTAQASGCVVTFTAITEDALKNVKVGLLPKDAKWVSKLTKKYPGVCYVEAAQKPSAVFYILVTPDTYHGTRTIANASAQSSPVTGTITDQDGNRSQIRGTETATSTSYDEVPYSLNYGIYALYVERPQGDGSFKVLQTFQQKGLYMTYAGIPLGGRGHHPAHAVIEDAVKWLSGGGLNDPTQGSVLTPEIPKPRP